MSSSPSPKRRLVIAIDGPAGSGKSTTARLLAAHLGYQYLDTGAMYRAVTLVARRRGISSSDGAALTAIAEQMDIRFLTEKEINRVFVNGEEVTQGIRTPEVTREVSEVSAHPGVRVAMVAKQQAIGKGGGIVAEGRDTTTMVFPHAEVKVYLRADVRTRAGRRLRDLDVLGIQSSVDEQVADLERRDAFDSGRAHSPLRQADDAIVVDTTDCTIEDQVRMILALVPDGS